MEREPRGTARWHTALRPGRWAALLLAAGLLAALPVLVDRARVEAAYRSVTLVAELPGRPWEQVLPHLAPALAERGAGALLLPVQALADPPAVEAARASGLPVFLFWQEPPAPGEIDRRLGEARQVGLATRFVGGVGGPGVPLPAGEAAGIEADGARIALVEMEGSPVWAGLAGADPGRAVVAHWIPPEDWEEYQGPGAAGARLARYVRAVRERQVRVLVVPLVPAAGGSIDLSYLEAVAGALGREGFTLDDPPGLPAFGAGPVQRFFMGAAVGAGLLLALGGLPSSGGHGARPAAGRRRHPWLPLALPAVLGVASLLPQGRFDPQAAAGVSGDALVAFLAAVIFPAWAVLSLRMGPRAGKPRYRRPLAGLAQAFTIALAGGLLVSGLLSGREALLRLELFRGVKAMHLASPLLVAAALLPGPLGAWLRSGGGAAARARPGSRGSRRPAWLGAAMVFLAALALVAVTLYYVGRTGNELVPVPGWERELRDEMEALLGARPRFKELFGHAALFAGLAVLGSPGGRTWRDASGGSQDPLPQLVGTGLLVAGTVGQLSVVNSLSHLHQPLLLTLQRVGYGALGGLALGAVLAPVVGWGLVSWQRWVVDRTSQKR